MPGLGSPRVINTDRFAGPDRDPGRPGNCSIHRAISLLNWRLDAAFANEEHGSTGDCRQQCPICLIASTTAQRLCVQNVTHELVLLWEILDGQRPASVRAEIVYPDRHREARAESDPGGTDVADERRLTGGRRIRSAAGAAREVGDLRSNGLRVRGAKIDCLRRHGLTADAQKWGGTKNDEHGIQRPLGPANTCW